MPTRAEFILGLYHVERDYPGIHLLHDGRVSAEEWALIEQSPKSIAFFHEVALFTGEHWEIPFTAVGLYIVLITVGPILMARRSVPLAASVRRSPRPARSLVSRPRAPVRAPPALRREPLPVKGLACAWNWLLAAFSTWGVVCTWSAIATRAYTYGFETTCCGHWVYMGRGPVAWAMLFFIYSKLFELLDTAFLVAKKTDVIFLHWYHHITVLLYCWCAPRAGRDEPHRAKTARRLPQRLTRCGSALACHWRPRPSAQALLLDAHLQRHLVRRDELFCARAHVCLFCDDAGRRAAHRRRTPCDADELDPCAGAHAHRACVHTSTTHPTTGALARRWARAIASWYGRMHIFLRPFRSFKCALGSRSTRA